GRRKQVPRKSIIPWKQNPNPIRKAKQTTVASNSRGSLHQTAEVDYVAPLCTFNGHLRLSHSAINEQHHSCQSSPASLSECNQPTALFLVPRHLRFSHSPINQQHHSCPSSPASLSE
ncbi:unnamed protein product, partial [Ectocarpus sp. 12 AP-2014]